MDIVHTESRIELIAVFRLSCLPVERLCVLLRWIALTHVECDR